MRNLFTLIVTMLTTVCVYSQTLYVPNNTSGIGSSLNGNVGIGTSNPQTTFEIIGNQFIRNTFFGGYTSLRLYNDQNYLLRSLEIDYSGSQYAGSLVTGGPIGESGSITTTGLFPLTFGTNNTCRMMIGSNGLVGIGTSTPGSKLHIYTPGSGAFRIQRDNSNVFGFEIGGTIFGLYDYTALQYKWRTNDGNLYLVESSGNVGIGTTNPGSFKLAVNGKIWSQEVNVAMTNPGPDYVFEKDYNLLPLSELETYINQNKHLPEVPSAKEMEVEGLNLKEMNLLLLKKVEELTLHLIQKEKQIDDLQSRVTRVENIAK